MRRPLTLMVLVILGAALLAVSMSASAKPSGGNNSLNAKQCYKGGYRTLARSTNPTIAFTSESACTSYAAMGGTLVRWTPPTNTPTNTATGTATNTPTNTPTDTPVVPTNTPTDTPTNTPVVPTNTPTDTPTNTPVVPTNTPTDTPTNTPVL